MGSEQVAAVLRQSGTQVRLVVARPIEPTSPDYQVKWRNKRKVSLFFLASGNIGETRFPKRCKNSETIFCHFWSAASNTKKKECSKFTVLLSQCRLWRRWKKSGRAGYDATFSETCPFPDSSQVVFFSPFVMARFQVPIFRVSEPLLLSLCLFPSLNVGIPLESIVKRKKNRCQRNGNRQISRPDEINEVDYSNWPII